MSQITLRGLDPDLEKKIRSRAKGKGNSVNRELLEILNQTLGTGPGKKRPAGESLRDLAGGWSEKDARSFNEAIKSCEQIDEDLWK